MKRFLLGLVVVGCQGGSHGGIHDASSNDDTSPVADGTRVDDANVLDGVGLDGPSRDAAVDAPSDAAVIDAPPDAGGVVGMPITCTGAPWCWVLPEPQGVPLRSIGGTSSTDIWVGTTQSSVLHFDGAAWVAYQFPPVTGQGVYSIFATATNDAWAARGSSGIMHWDGATWSQATTQPAVVLGGSSATDVWGGYVTGTRHWNGTTWTDTGGPTDVVAFGGASGSTWAVTKTGAILKWLGSSWGTLVASSRPTNAAVVIDDTHIVLAHDKVITLWDGAQFVVNTPPVQANWTSVVATSFDDISIAGIGSGVLYHYAWNGTTWTASTSPATGLGQLWEAPDHAVWSATEAAELLVRTGTTWSSKTLGDNLGKFVWGASEDDRWVFEIRHFRELVGWHWNGAAWTQVAIATWPGSLFLNHVWGRASNDIWIGAGGRQNFQMERLLYHWDGTTWTEKRFGAQYDFAEEAGIQGIWAAAANDVYATSSTTLFHFDGTTWSEIPEVPRGGNTESNFVFGSAANDVYVSRQEHLWHWNGLAWTMVTAPGQVTCGIARSPTDIWMCPGIHYDGTFFQPIDPGDGTHPEFQSFFARGNHVVGGTTRSDIYDWTSGIGTAPTKRVRAPHAKSLWLSELDRLFAAGTGLIVYP